MVRRWSRLVSAAGLAALAATAFAGFSSGASAASGVTHVYVNDNTAGVNTVAGFVRNADGTLTSLAGSPFAAGGAGTGTTVGSQGSLQATADGRFILAADAGSDQISVLASRLTDRWRRLPAAHSRRAASSPSASRYMTTWCMSPMRATASPAATTADSD